MKELVYRAQSTLFEIQQEVIDLSFLWKSYNQLFDSDSTSLAYEISPVFFTKLKEILQKNIIITITRLFDPKDNKRGGQVFGQNIGYYLLLGQLIEEEYPGIGIGQFRARIESFRQKYSALFTYRNKLIAHNDLDMVKDWYTKQELEQIFSTTDFATVIGNLTNLTNDFVEFFYTSSILSEEILLAHHIYKLNFEGINTDAYKMISPPSKEGKSLK